MTQFDASALHRVCTRILLKSPETRYYDGHYFHSATSFGDFFISNYFDCLHVERKGLIERTWRTKLLEEGNSFLNLVYEGNLGQDCLIVHPKNLRDGSMFTDDILELNPQVRTLKTPIIYRPMKPPHFIISSEPWLHAAYDTLLEHLAAL